jgi:prepilin-type N-terminal cleavage/methylation domain-containing protein
VRIRGAEPAAGRHRRARTGEGAAFPGSRPAAARRNGLTLVELLLAITLLAIVAGITCFSFDAGAKAWRTGTEIADSLHHADYILEQMAMGLRSAYYPDAERPVGAYGFALTDDGDGDEARDAISWVKLGTSLVGADSPLSDTPHRVVVTVAPPGEGDAPGMEDGGLTIRAWRIAALPEEFDPQRDVEPLCLSPRVTGFNCRVLDPAGNLAEGDAPSAADELEWIDEWKDDHTNRLPYAVEIGLYLAPPPTQRKPLAVKRVVEIPLAPLAWRDKGAAGGRTATGGAARRRRQP